MTEKYKPRLIDAEALRNRFLSWMHKNTQQSDIRDDMAEAAIMDVDEAPTIDAEPVRHAHWACEGYIDQHCSNCGGGICREYPDGNVETPDYCSDCGAKMDEKVPPDA